MPSNFFHPVQALEHAEQLVDVFHVESDAVVPDRHDQLIRPMIRASAISISARGRVRVNLTAFEIRLTSTRRSMARSPYQAGNVADPPDDVAPFRLLRDLAQGLLHELLQADRCSCASRRGRSCENASRSSISVPIRFADSRIIVTCRRPLSSSAGPALFCSSSVNPAMCRIGARRSCETE